MMLEGDVPGWVSTLILILARQYKALLVAHFKSELPGR